MDLFQLDEKIAVVTGGNRGIGLAIARGLADAGAVVVLVARDQERLGLAVQQIIEAGGSGQAIVLDVQDIDAGQAMIEQVVEQQGKIDILVNNAGMNIRDLAVDVQRADYNTIMNTNLRAPFFLSQAAGRHMIAARSGKIVNIASMTSYVGLNKASVYAATKGALVQMTRTMASEWGEYNVQVNAVAPGFIHTDLNASMWEREDMINWVIGNTPAKRLGKPEDLVGAVHFLASPASDFVTGQLLAVDGGFIGGGPWPL